MRPFITHNDLVLPFDRVNVDTDQMVRNSFEGVTRELWTDSFYDWQIQTSDGRTES
jgi:3-isopropylmalate dehydratase small subunit